jgi:hypothetical protein
MMYALVEYGDDGQGWPRGEAGEERYVAMAQSDERTGDEVNLEEATLGSISAFPY